MRIAACAPILLTVLMALLALAGCASMLDRPGQRQAGSIVDYLYPDSKQAPAMAPTVTHLKLPVRVGIAFVPGSGWSGGPTPQMRTQLLERVKASFARYDYIAGIEVIPSDYLRARGGFDNLDQVARMFNVDVVALVSYDQVRFNDTNRLAVLYWTVVGAYLIKGDQYDVQTMVDAAVFDVRSRKLLFRAPGTSRVKGSATMTGYGKQVRGAQADGYDQAVEDLIPNLQAELADFKERVRNDPAIRVEGGRGAGGTGWPLALAMAGIAGIGFVVRRRHA
nr:rhombotarget lipoprotein [uncultured Massilia sp.]